ncbi:ComF family protein [Legionella clemsonensis]|uniref:DNA utilization protein GntX n=1 Tax=Legionella clemsonensis TaxID=1867846 RepID=A0A222P4D4_9GAMM|nr:ComF family protein [Legionella clemsonensis]ASQ46699.1 DNA utilization protein GntX [Legionella clemsonensis]
MRYKKRSITHLLRLPSACIICGKYHQDIDAVCPDCLNLLQPLGPACQYCALPLSDDGFLVCGRCSKQKPAFDKTWVLYRFEEPLRTLLHEYKYNGALYLRRLLVKLMMDALPQEELTTQCLIPVPLHYKKLRERGFNQAAEFSKMLSNRLKIPYELTLTQKVLHTPAQVSLNGRKRRHNLQHAFRIKKQAYQHITLIDDLLTTGSTVNELAKLFKQQGVTRVDVWCCARAC